MEEYKYIPDSNEKYKISTNGNVLAVKKNKPIRQQKRNDRRTKLFVRLFIEDKWTEKYINKLVCEIFIKKVCNGERKSLYGYKWEWDT